MGKDQLPCFIISRKVPAPVIRAWRHWKALRLEPLLPWKPCLIANYPSMECFDPKVLTWCTEGSQGCTVGWPGHCCLSTLKSKSSKVF